MNDAEKPSSDEVEAEEFLQVRNLRSDDEQILEQLMTFYRPYLISIAEQFLPGSIQSRVDRSDLVQETLMRGLAQRDQFRGTTDAELGAWLRKILQNVALDWVRHHTADKRSVHREAKTNVLDAKSQPTPSQDYFRKEEFERIAEAMTKLTKEQRTTVELRSQGLTFGEIGERMNRSEDAVRMLWGRGLASLMELLRRDGCAE
ncbi:sigma-70 family RNA polymerase sigma factor [Planctomicrobium sp. SH661]|uniref:sigma-70 family RNA polymerase sigma factor n=1 Tax=Planctomicrobium sp. SH661 TaxID=3448124 RepID=UPI003F5BDD87